jgi:hypothetical protein
MDPLKDLITATGALAEMMRMFRDELMKNGFTRTEAITLTQAFMVAQITKSKEDN